MKKKIVEKLISIVLKPITFVAKKTNNQEFLLNIVCKDLENDSLFPSFRIREKDSAKTPLINSPRQCKNEFAILLQGPLCKKDCMTINSIRFYKKLYPEAVIILSTWNGENEQDLKKCVEEGAILVLSEKPSKSGILNINYQLVSSKNGMLKAKELGVKYIAKTRTDQRICKPFVFLSLMKLLEEYPIKDRNCKLNKRIIVTPTHINNMFTPFFMSDFFYFGTTEDIIKLFSVDLDERENIPHKDLFSRRDYSKDCYPPEIYLLKNYIKSYTSNPCGDKVEDYWSAIKEYLLCVDREFLDIFITKYNYSHNDGILLGKRFSYDNLELKMTMKFGFLEWIALYNDQLEYDPSFEAEADVGF